MIKKIYGIFSLLFLIIVILVFSVIDRTNNINLSLTIEIILIAYLVRITWGCLIYVKDEYKKHKYSYSIIMNLGLVLFIIINIIRLIILFIYNWNSTTINDIYINTLNSFSFFAILTLPMLLILAIFSFFTNIILIKKEGLELQNILGIIFGITIIAGALVSQFAFEFMRKIEFVNSQIYIKKFIDIGLNAILCYYYCITIATLYCNILAARHKPKYDKDFVIVLGAKIKDDGSLTPLLKARVDKALEFAREQKDREKKRIIFIPSGGQGDDEVTSEAEAMKNYLIEQGIDEKDILVENKSTNTKENITYSKELIDQKNKTGNIIFSTTNYHVFRSGVIANNAGIECEGIGSKTKWYFYTNALIREFIANLFAERKRHIGLITIINIFIFLLVLIGYKYNLI